MGRFKRHAAFARARHTATTLPRQVKKVGRNDPCPCGSDKKYKDCHESEGSAYLEKLVDQENREKLRELRSELKKKGVPWYRRWFLGS